MKRDWGNELTRALGMLLVLAGLAAVGHGYAIDTSVDTAAGIRVQNLGLIEQQRKEMIAGGVVAGVGCAIFLAGEMGAKSKS